jgi:hypothetical protein
MACPRANVIKQFTAVIYCHSRIRLSFYIFNVVKNITVI